jgi:hypothetical protein
MNDKIVGKGKHMRKLKPEKLPVGFVNTALAPV